MYILFVGSFLLNNFSSQKIEYSEKYRNLLFLKSLVWCSKRFLFLLRLVFVLLSCIYFQCSVFDFCPIDKPEVIVLPRSQNVNESDSFSIFCNAIGKPTPTIKWTKQGNSTVLSTNAFLNVSSAIRGSKHHCGDYICSAENSVGVTEKVASVTVQCEYHV